MAGANQTARYGAAQIFLRADTARGAAETSRVERGARAGTGAGCTAVYYRRAVGRTAPGGNICIVLAVLPGGGAGRVTNGSAPSWAHETGSKSGTRNRDKSREQAVSVPVPCSLFRAVLWRNTSLVPLVPCSRVFVPAQVLLKPLALKAFLSYCTNRNKRNK